MSKWILLGDRETIVNLNHVRAWEIRGNPPHDLVCRVNRVSADAEGIRWVRSAAADTATVTVPAHKAGDLLLVSAFHFASTVPGLPTGFTSLAADTFSTLAYRVAWQVSDGTTTSITATNAQQIHVVIYRGTDQGTPIGTWTTLGLSTSAPSISALTQASMVQDGSSWVAGIVAHQGAGGELGDPYDVPPIVKRSQAGAGTPRSAMFDTATGVRQFGQQNFPSIGSSNNTYSFTIELIADPRGVAGVEELVALQAGDLTPPPLELESTYLVNLIEALPQLAMQAIPLTELYQHIEGLGGQAYPSSADPADLHSRADEPQPAPPPEEPLSVEGIPEIPDPPPEP